MIHGFDRQRKFLAERNFPAFERSIFLDPLLDFESARSANLCEQMRASRDQAVCVDAFDNAYAREFLFKPLMETSVIARPAAELVLGGRVVSGQNGPRLKN